DPHAAASKDLSIGCLHKSSGLSNYRFLHGIRKFDKRLGKGLFIVVLHSFLHLGRKLGLLLFKQIEVLHFSSSPSLSFEANASRNVKRPMSPDSGSSGSWSGAGPSCSVSLACAWS